MVDYDSKYGPVFREGPDLFCGSNFMNKKSTGAKFPNSYKDVLDKGNSVFTGNVNKNISSFILKELEVFELFKW